MRITSDPLMMKSTRTVNALPSEQTSLSLMRNLVIWNEMEALFADIKVKELVPAWREYTVYPSARATAETLLSLTISAPEDPWTSSSLHTAKNKNKLNVVLFLYSSR